MKAMRVPVFVEGKTESAETEREETKDEKAEEEYQGLNQDLAGGSRTRRHRRV